MPKIPALPKKMRSNQQSKPVVKATKKQLSVQKRRKGIYNKKRVEKSTQEKNTVKVYGIPKSDKGGLPGRRNVNKKTVLKRGSINGRENDMVLSKLSFKPGNDSADHDISPKNRGIDKSKTSPPNLRSNQDNKISPKWTIKFKPKGTNKSVSAKSKEIRKFNSMNRSRKNTFNKLCLLQPKVVLTRLPSFLNIEKTEGRGAGNLLNQSNSILQDDEHQKYGLIETLGLVKCVRKIENNTEIPTAANKFITTTQIPLPEVNESIINSFHGNIESMNGNMTTLTSADNFSNIKKIVKGAELRSNRNKKCSNIVGVNSEFVYNPKLSIQSEKKRFSNINKDIVPVKQLMPTSSVTVCDSYNDSRKYLTQKISANLTGKQKLQNTSSRKVEMSGRKLKSFNKELPLTRSSSVTTASTETHLKRKKLQRKSHQRNYIDGDGSTDNHQSVGSVLHVNTEKVDSDMTNPANLKRSNRNSNHKRSMSERKAGGDCASGSNDIEEQITDIGNKSLNANDIDIANLKKIKINKNLNEGSVLSKMKFNYVDKSYKSYMKQQPTGDCAESKSHDRNVEILDESDDQNMPYIDCDNMSWCSVNKLSLHDKLQGMECAVKNLQGAIEKLKTTRSKHSLNTILENNSESCEDYNLFEILEDIIKDSSQNKYSPENYSASAIIDLMIKYHCDKQKGVAKG